MGSEHEPDPLVSPRGDPSDDDPGGAGEAPPASSPAEPTEPAELAEPGEPAEPGEAGGERLTEPASATGPRSSDRRRRGQSSNMLPVGRVRSGPERKFVRVIATGGIIGIGVVIAAIMTSSHSQGWLIGLVVSVVSVVLAAVLWSSRML